MRVCSLEEQKVGLINTRWCAFYSKYLLLSAQHGLQILLHEPELLVHLPRSAAGVSPGCQGCEGTNSMQTVTVSQSSALHIQTNFVKKQNARPT